MKKYFEELEHGELLCSMIYTFAKVCGVLHYPHWDQQNHADHLRYSEALQELCSMIYDHRQQFEDEEDATPFDSGIWYRENWRIFPWGEPEYSNLTEINQEFVLSCAEFSISMSGHYGTMTLDEKVHE
jgi:hypothetical protein